MTDDTALGDLPSTATERASAQARLAWDRGHAAMADGMFESARTWFARACRLVPEDPTPALSLAAACLVAGHAAEASALFRDVAERTDAGVAWLGLASACAGAGNPAGAASALHAALSRHALSGLGDGGMADSIAREAGAAGWYGLDQAGRLVGRARGTPCFYLDGQRVTVGFGGVPHGSGGRLSVRVGRRHLLGSPIELALIRRLEGLVRVAEDGGLSGWAWHPGDPARVPILTLRAGAVTRTIRATDPLVTAPHPLAEPRGFRVTARDLADLPEPIAVLGPDGTPIAGSPVSPRALAAAMPVPANVVAARPARAERCPDRKVAVVVPVYRGLRETMACLRDVLRTAPDAALIVVDDASPEPALVTALDALASSDRARLLRHTDNRGFPAAANTGLLAAMALDPPHDVVLLNSDTRLPPGWLHRLRHAVQSRSDVGTATPLSNDASLASYPDPAGGNPPPAGRERTRIARLAARANPDTVVDVPTGVGFCLYLRRECLTQTGLLREDVFAGGYGEENDFSLRATRLGWRHVVVPGAYVAHLGGRSFGTARTALLDRNQHVLERLHPGYRALVDRWSARDPLAPARRRLDLARRAARPASRLGSVLLVTHDNGGGVDRCLRDRAASLRDSGYQPIVLRPVPDRRASPDPSWRRTIPGLVRIDEPGFPNLVFRLPDEGARLADALRPTRPTVLEVHHLLGHARAVLDLAVALAIPVEFRLHDYAAFCPRLTLTSADGRYCGEPDMAGCVDCVAAHGSLLEEAIGPAALRARSATDLAGARRVVVPSADMAARMRRHFPALAMTVVPHEPDLVAPRPAPSLHSREHRVLLVGGIGLAKGFDVLLACARDAAVHRLTLRFIVVGHTIDDDLLLDTGRVDVTGPYREGQAASLIAGQEATVGFLPSLWPETWCFALSEMLAAGLPVAAFDIGAQAERIRRAGGGWLLPLGLPAAKINWLLQSLPASGTNRLAAPGNVMQTASMLSAPRSPSESAP